MGNRAFNIISAGVEEVLGFLPCAILGVIGKVASRLAINVDKINRS